MVPYFEGSHPTRVSRVVHLGLRSTSCVLLHVRAAAAGEPPIAPKAKLSVPYEYRAGAILSILFVLVDAAECGVLVPCPRGHAHGAMWHVVWPIMI